MTVTEARAAAETVFLEADADQAPDGTLAWLEDGTGSSASTGDTLGWLEAELEDTWARVESSNTADTEAGQQKSGLLAETAPSVVDLASLLNEALGGGSSRGVMVPQRGLEPPRA